MLIGVDFDNTIVCYDQVFLSIARERGLISPDQVLSKRELHDYLHGRGQADVWTQLQGEVYGPLMQRAIPFPGVIDFFRRCRVLTIPVRIISHRTRYPYLGEKYDLHLAARNWIATHAIGLSSSEVFFDESRLEKLARIAQQKCTHFVEDLVEVLAEPLFPKDVHRILFDPNHLHGDFALAERVESWAMIESLLLPAR